MHLRQEGFSGAGGLIDNLAKIPFYRTSPGRRPTTQCRSCNATGSRGPSRGKRQALRCWRFCATPFDPQSCWKTQATLHRTPDRSHACSRRILGVSTGRTALSIGSFPSSRRLSPARSCGRYRFSHDPRRPMFHDQDVGANGSDAGTIFGQAHLKPHRCVLGTSDRQFWEGAALAHDGDTRCVN